MDLEMEIEMQNIFLCSQCTQLLTARDSDIENWSHVHIHTCTHTHLCLLDERFNTFGLVHFILNVQKCVSGILNNHANTIHYSFKKKEKQYQNCSEEWDVWPYVCEAENKTQARDQRREQIGGLELTEFCASILQLPFRKAPIWIMVHFSVTAQFNEPQQCRNSDQWLIESHNNNKATAKSPMTMCILSLQQ